MNQTTMNRTKSTRSSSYGRMEHNSKQPDEISYSLKMR